MDSTNAEFELREARDELSRYKKYITNITEALEWALVMVEETNPELSFGDKERIARYKILLHRQLS